MGNTIENKFTVEYFLGFDMYDLCEFCIENGIEINLRSDSKLDVIYAIMRTLCPEAINEYEEKNNWNELTVDYYTTYSLEELMKYTDEAVLNETKRVCADLELKPDKKWTKEEQCIFLIKVCDMNKYTNTYILPNSVNNKDEESCECINESKDPFWDKTRKELKEICSNENIEIGDNWKKERLIKAIKEKQSQAICEV